MNTQKLKDTAEFRALWDDNVPADAIADVIGFTGRTIRVKAREFGYRDRDGIVVRKRGYELRGGADCGTPKVKPVPDRSASVRCEVALDGLLATKGKYAALTAWAKKHRVSSTVALQRWHAARVGIRGGGVI